MQEFEGKVAALTGTANRRGIGMAIARRLGGLGCHVVLSDLDRDNVRARAEELQQDGVDAIAVVADMGDHAAVMQLADATYDRFGRCDILVLNHVAAGGRPGHGLISPEPDAWELHVQVNLLGTIFGIKAFLPRMIAGGEHGHVLATTSGAGGTGLMYGNGPYSTTKAAIVSLMECLYGQLRDVGADIVPSLIFPGVTNTFPDPDITRMTIDMLRSTGVPVTWTEPEEVAEHALEAIRTDSFWARPAPDDPQHGETVDWEAQIYRARADALITRAAPDSYLWGPRSDVLG